MQVFETLNSIDVGGHIDKKKTGNATLSYLSWPWAWAEVKKRYPEAAYEVKTDENGLPYVYDEKTGYMVFTTVSIDGIMHEMWLPVMDSHNAAMKSETYEVQTKYSSYTVAAATMFDINKTIMRCLVKNLAMFGLGLYIYAGEDLPASAKETKPEQSAKSEELEGKAAILAGLREVEVSMVRGWLLNSNYAKEREIYDLSNIDKTDSQALIMLLDGWIQKAGD